MKQRNLIVLLLLALSIQAQGAINSISGTIRNSETLEPLPYANVIIKDTYLGTTSNVDGYFYLSGLKSDSIVVVCSYIGYKPFSRLLVTGAETHIILPISMDPIALGGEEVVVEDSLVIAPEVMLTTLIPTENETAVEIPMLQGSDLEQLEYWFELRPPLPWLPPMEPGLQVVIDGVPVEPTRHLYGIYPAFNLEAVKLVAHHTPGALVLAGNPYREVTELVYREGNRTAFDFEGNLGLVETGLTTSGPHPLGGTWYLSGRRVDYDGIYSMAPQRSDSVYTDFMPDYYFYDINSKVTFDVSEATKASITGYMTYDKLHWLGKQARSAHSSWYSRFLSLRVRQRWNPQLVTTANLHTIRNHAFFRANSIPLGIGRSLDGDLVHENHTLGMTANTELYLGRNNGVEFGLGLQKLDPLLELTDSTAANLPAPFVTSLDLKYHHSLPYNLGAELGLHGLSLSDPGEFTLSPIFNLKWSPSNVYGAYLNLTESKPLTRSISFSNTLDQPLFDVVIPIDNSLERSSVLAMRMGVKVVPFVGIDMGGEFFMEQIRNPVLMDSSWNGDLSDQSKWLLPYDAGSRSGFRIHAEKRTPGIHARLNYRYQTGTLTDTAENEIPLLGERDHRMALTLQGDFAENSGYSLEAVLASGRHYLEADDSEATSGLYHRIDVSLYRSIQINRVSGRISLGLYNLTGASAEKLSDDVWSPLSPGERDYALLPFLPTVQLEFTF